MILNVYLQKVPSATAQWHVLEKYCLLCSATGWVAAFLFYHKVTLYFACGVTGPSKTKVSCAAREATGPETHFQISHFSSCFLWYIAPVEPFILNQKIGKSFSDLFNLVFSNILKTIFVCTETLQETH